MKTLVLNVEYDYDFDLFGIVSSGKDYKLAWALNKLLNVKLVKQKDLCLDLLNRQRLVIGNYLHFTDHSSLRLFKNRCIGISTLKHPFLLPDIKEYDYILQLTGTMRQLHPQEFVQKILCLPLVQYVKHFDPLTLKYKDNLIF